MTLYTRHQLGVLLILLGATGLGLAVGHWRRAHPELVDRLEMLDRSPAPFSGSLATPVGGNGGPIDPCRTRLSARLRGAARGDH